MRRVRHWKQGLQQTLQTRPERSRLRQVFPRSSVLLRLRRVEIHLLGEARMQKEMSQHCESCTPSFGSHMHDHHDTRPTARHTTPRRTIMLQMFLNGFIKTAMRVLASTTPKCGNKGYGVSLSHAVCDMAVLGKWVSS